MAIIRTPLDRFRASFGIDISGPNFFDFHPTPEDVRARVVSTGAFRAWAIGWISDEAMQGIRDLRSVTNIVQSIARTGGRLSPDDLAERGFGTRDFIGRDFADALISTDLDATVSALSEALSCSISTASKLHNLRRMEEAGITDVVFRSPRDERETPLERELDGQKMQIEAARSITRERGDELARGRFGAVLPDL